MELRDKNKAALLQEEPVTAFFDEQGRMTETSHDPRDTGLDDTTDDHAYNVALVGFEGDRDPSGYDISNRGNYPTGISSNPIDWTPTHRDLAVINAEAKVLHVKKELAKARLRRDQENAFIRQFQIELKEARNAVRTAKAIPHE